MNYDRVLTKYERDKKEKTHGKNEVIKVLNTETRGTKKENGVVIRQLREICLQLKSII